MEFCVCSRVCVKRLNNVDWISNLPESLLLKVLLNLRTKDVVRTSVLSKRWRNLWRYIPGLDVDNTCFPDYKTLVSFVDAFLGFNSDSYLENFKLVYDYGRSIGKHNGNIEFGLVSRRWINTIVDRRVKNFYVDDYLCMSWDIPKLYTCKSLVSLKLFGVTLACLKFGFLPSLKFLDLSIEHVTNALDIEKLISGCPVLESLFIAKCFDDGIEVLHVRSQSLLRFTHVSNGICFSVKYDLEINAPRLQYLRISDHRIGSLILNNTISALVEANIDTVFNWSFEDNIENDLQKRRMIGSFLEGISCVKDMAITSKTFEVIYHYSKCEQLPLFRNLLFLRFSFPSFRWKMMPIFFESCPNLKSLVVAWNVHHVPEGTSILSVPRCLLSSLEFVDIETPLSHRWEMKLVSYFLENSETLKKLTIRLDISMRKEESAIVNELLVIPRLSSPCQVIVL